MATVYGEVEGSLGPVEWRWNGCLQHVFEVFSMRATAVPRLFRGYVAHWGRISAFAGCYTSKWGRENPGIRHGGGMGLAVFRGFAMAAFPARLSWRVRDAPTLTYIARKRPKSAPTVRDIELKP
ncbi:hypothetical protein JS538_05515 [Bifidobacterium vespertilionis]|nr:hypothetical protein [Bifidobacterium vespertilionis]